MTKDQMIELLQNVGFTRYEAQTYMALLTIHPATGYEISRHSGVPHAKIYETLPRLLEKQAVILLPGEPARYQPNPPHKVIAQLRRSYLSSLEKVQLGLKDIQTPSLALPPKTLADPTSLIAETESVLLTAERPVWIQGPEGFILTLHQPLEHRKDLGLFTHVELTGDTGILVWEEEGTVITGRWNNEVLGLAGDHPSLQLLARQIFNKAVDPVAGNVVDTIETSLEKPAKLSARSTGIKPIVDLFALSVTQIQ